MSLMRAPIHAGMAPHEIESSLRAANQTLAKGLGVPIVAGTDVELGGGMLAGKFMMAGVPLMDGSVYQGTPKVVLGKNLPELLESAGMVKPGWGKAGAEALLAHELGHAEDMLRGKGSGNLLLNASREMAKIMHLPEGEQMDWLMSPKGKTAVGQLSALDRGAEEAANWYATQRVPGIDKVFPKILAEDTHGMLEALPTPVVQSPEFQQAHQQAKRELAQAEATRSLQAIDPVVPKLKIDPPRPQQQVAPTPALPKASPAPQAEAVKEATREVEAKAVQAAAVPQATQVAVHAETKAVAAAATAAGESGLGTRMLQSVGGRGNAFLLAAGLGYAATHRHHSRHGTHARGRKQGLASTLLTGTLAGAAAIGTYQSARPLVDLGLKALSERALLETGKGNAFSVVAKLLESSKGGGYFARQLTNTRTLSLAAGLAAIPIAHRVVQRALAGWHRHHLDHREAAFMPSRQMGQHGTLGGRRMGGPQSAPSGSGPAVVTTRGRLRTHYDTDRARQAMLGKGNR